MAAPIYYVPGTKRPSRSDVEALGLADVVHPGSQPAPINGGPDGGAGFVVHGHGNTKRLGYYPEHQTWVQGSGYWLGWNNDDPPGPEDLKRPETMPGHAVKLRDGRDWLVPVGRRFAQVSAFPHVLRFADGGFIQGEAIEQYVELSQRAQRVADAFRAQHDERGDDRSALTVSEGAETAAMALGINYRLRPFEVGAFGLLTDHNYVQVLAALIDVPTILEVSRRMEAEGKADAATRDGSPIASGGPASAPEITPQPSPSGTGFPSG